MEIIRLRTLTRKSIIGWGKYKECNVEHRYATSVGIPELPEQLKVWCAVENDIQDRAIASRIDN